VKWKLKPKREDTCWAQPRAKRLVHYRNPGHIIIKVDPVKGSRNAACGTQQVPVGAGIPIHIHFGSAAAGKLPGLLFCEKALHRR
jgi:hypothetical protein